MVLEAVVHHVQVAITGKRSKGQPENALARALLDIIAPLALSAEAVIGLQSPAPWDTIALWEQELPVRLENIFRMNYALLVLMDIIARVTHLLYPVLLDSILGKELPPFQHVLHVTRLRLQRYV